MTKSDIDLIVDNTTDTGWSIGIDDARSVGEGIGIRYSYQGDFTFTVWIRDSECRLQVHSMEEYVQALSTAYARIVTKPHLSNKAKEGMYVMFNRFDRYFLTEKLVVLFDESE